MQSSTFLMNQFRLTATTTAAQAVLVTTSASLAVTAMTRARPSTATVHDDAVDAMNALGRIFNEQRVTLRNDNSDQKFKGLPANIYQGSVRSEANHLVSIFRECTTSPPPTPARRRARTRSPRTITRWLLQLVVYKIWDASRRGQVRSASSLLLSSTATSSKTRRLAPTGGSAMRSAGTASTMSKQHRQSASRISSFHL
ncbi:hypothetical protein IWZ00DRAFT_510818 [Phyllosticta capitalensis]